MVDTYAEILLAACNGEAYIREQIESILAQKDERWHLTLSDDGSTDGTPAILDEYAGRYPEKITRYHSGVCFGNARDHFFHLMIRCGAPYMLFCDQDDVWGEDKLGATLDALMEIEARRGADCPALAFTDQTPVDEQLVPLADSLMRYQQQYAETFDFRAILMQNVVTGGAMGVNQALAQKAACCARPQETIMHDWWLAAGAACFGEIAYIDRPMSLYRQHGKNSVGAKDVRSARYVLGMLGKIDALREAIARKKRQAVVFCASYSAELTTEQRLWLARFAVRRSGAGFYWKNRGLIHGLHRLLGFMLLG